MIVLPAKAIAKGQRFALQVVYGGFPKPIPDPTVDGSDAPGLGWTNWRATSYVVSEPVGAGTWYPVNDEPTDKAGYRFTITVSKPYIAVANGVPLSVTDLGAKRRIRLGAGPAHGELSRDHRRRPVYAGSAAFRERGTNP